MIYNFEKQIIDFLLMLQTLALKLPFIFADFNGQKPNQILACLLQHSTLNF